MAIKELHGPSESPASGLRHEALTMALGILLERIQRLPHADRDDLFELLKALSSDDQEEVESAVVTIREILEQSPSRVRRMETPSDSSQQASGLSKWIDFVSRRIAEARSEAGLTQAELAEKSGLPQSHISRLESGKHSPSHATLQKIAGALGLPASTFDPSA
jgi:DNA-binding XRE family transcriptional regulator